jgi:hypothetical protein
VSELVRQGEALATMLAALLEQDKRALAGAVEPDHQAVAGTRDRVQLHVGVGVGHER